MAGYVVNIPVHGVKESDIAAIAATIRNGNIDTVSGSHRITKEGGMIDINVLNEEKQDIKTQNFVYNLKEDDIQTSDALTNDNSVRPQGLKCDICKSLYNVVNSIGCGVGAATMCAAAGFGTGGGALGPCVVIVPGFCAIYKEYQDHKGMSAENICGDGIPGAPDPGLGYC